MTEKQFFWSSGDISLMTSEGEILTAASPLAGRCF
jgi:hypothetical protein